jgi:hypothetical protein
MLALTPKVHEFVHECWHSYIERTASSPDNIDVGSGRVE